MAKRLTDEQKERGYITHEEMYEMGWATEETIIAFDEVDRENPGKIKITKKGFPARRKGRNALKALRAKEAHARAKRVGKAVSAAAKKKRERKQKAVSKLSRAIKEKKKSRAGNIVDPEIVNDLDAASRRAFDEAEADNVVFRPNEGPQMDFLSAPEKDVLYGGAAGGGKAQPLYSLVATPYGWKRMGDIEVGDVVSTPTGGTATVTQLHPQGTKEIYKVTMQDGSSCECTADHLWYSKPVRDGKDRWKVRSTQELINSTRAFVLPLGSVEREEVELPVDPYVIGCLLGDGSTTTNSIGFTTADEECIEYLRESVEVSQRKGKYQYGILGINSELRALDIIGKNSHTKAIPELYKQGSIEQRLEVLRGLMDTDGYVSVDGKVNYTSVSEQLRNDVAELIRSVGGTAKLMKGHTLYIRHPNSASLFKLKRKKARCHTKNINNKILSIKKAGEYEAQCITIDSDEQLYVTDNYIVTHNSYAMLVDPLRYAHRPAHRALILRRSMPELRELIDKSRELYPQAFPGVKFREADKIWVFPSGAKLEFSFLERDSDVYKYQGQAYSWIGFDEITHMQTDFAWNYLASRLRTTDPEITTYMRCIPYGDVLTEHGWKDIKEVRCGDLVHSVNPEGDMELKEVTKFHQYLTDEELVKYKSKNLDMVFTQDHRIVYENSTGLVAKKWRDLPARVNIKRTGEWDRESTYTPPLEMDKKHYLMLLGIYLAEGSVNHTPRKGNYKVIISQKKEHTQKEICNLLDKIANNYCVSANGDIQITKKLWWEHFKQFGYSQDKHIPRDVLENCDYNELAILHQWMMKGDGHWQSPNSGGYYTVSKQLADDFDELCTKLGYRVSNITTKSNNPKWRDKYTTHFCLHNTSELRKAEAEYIPYKGDVYCLSVTDNENFLVRQNGKVWVSGNCTANPGGSGAHWVKKRYIDPAPPNTSFEDNFGVTRKFIPARLDDNPYLADTDYKVMLQSLPEVQRKQLLEGNWDVNEDSAFPEFNPVVHAVDPFEIPKHWNRVKGIDYGYASESAVVWAAIDPDDDTLIIYRELYKKGMTGEDLAAMMTELEKEDPYSISGVLDTAAWNRTGYTGPTIGETLVRAGHKLRPADKNRIAGKIQVHERLKLAASGRPKMVIFRSCPNLIRELQSLPSDKSKPEDVDTKAQDHAYDALRYLIMSRPRAQSPFEQMFQFKQSLSYEMADEDFGY